MRRRLAGLAWRTRVRLGHWAPFVLGSTLAVVALRAALGPPPTGRTARGAAWQEVETWREWRARLREADGQRRSGRIDDALRTYDRVTRALSARPADRGRARYWHARLRLDRGEHSALLDLDSLVHASDDPALVARCALLALPLTVATSSRGSVRRSDDVVVDARARLGALARHEGPEGERARRWLERLEHAHARLFSR